MTSMAREAVTTSYITTKLRRIPNGLLGSNERTSLSHERLPSFPLYIYILWLFRRLHPPSFERGSRKWEIARNRIPVGADGRLPSILRSSFDS